MRYQGRMSNAKVRAGWPHAVVVEASALTGLGVHLSGAYPSISERTSFVVDERARRYVVLRFADAEEAELFRRRAHGEVYDAKDRRWTNNTH